MKKTIAPNRKLGRMMAKNLIILLTLAIVAFIGMWSWFTNTVQADASGIQLECRKPDGIEIAIVEPGATPKESDYTEDPIILDKEDTERFPFLEDLALSEITSNGITFYKPALTQSSGIATPNPDAEWEVAAANESYLSFDLYIRSRSSQTISLTTNSKFITNAENTTGALYPSCLSGSSASNKSAYGNFSKDCVVGAARFSVVDGTTRKLLWIPRPDLKLNDNQGKFSVSTGLTSGTSYNHVYYEVSGTKVSDTKTKTTMPAASVTTSNKQTGSNYYTLAKKTEITKLSTKGTDDYYTNHVTCNMWIEGDDDEARLALVDGKFLIDLDLTIK